MFKTNILHVCFCHATEQETLNVCAKWRAAEFPGVLHCQMKGPTKVYKEINLADTQLVGKVKEITK